MRFCRACKAPLLAHEHIYCDSCRVEKGWEADKADMEAAEKRERQKAMFGGER